MKHSASITVIGGDNRQAYLAQMLRQDGHHVSTYALERHHITDCIALEDLDNGLQYADAVILPLPVLHGATQLNAPLSNKTHLLRDVLDAIPSRVLTLAGSVPFWVHAQAVQNELHLIDYLAREDLAIRNAVPAALSIWLL